MNTDNLGTALTGNQETEQDEYFYSIVLRNPSELSTFIKIIFLLIGLIGGFFLVFAYVTPSKDPLAQSLRVISGSLVYISSLIFWGGWAFFLDRREGEIVRKKRIHHPTEEAARAAAIFGPGRAKRP